MSVPGHSSSEADIQDLEQKPEPEDIGGGDGNDGDVKEEKDESHDSGPRIEDEVGSEDTGNSSAGADHRHPGVGTEDDLDQARSQPAKYIEKDKPEGAEKILYVVPEYPQEQHVAQEMEQAPMEKHGGKQGEGGREPRKIRQRGEMGDFIRDDAHFLDIKREPLGRKYLKKKNQDVEDDDDDRDDGEAAGRVLISKRKEHG